MSARCIRGPRFVDYFQARKQRALTKDCRLTVGVYGALPVASERDLSSVASEDNLNHHMKFTLRLYQQNPHHLVFASAILSSPGTCTTLLTNTLAYITPEVHATTSHIQVWNNSVHLDGRSLAKREQFYMLVELYKRRRLHYMEFLRRQQDALSNSDIVFVDYDMLFVDQLHLPPAGWAVALTPVPELATREHRFVNGGFIAVHRGHITQGLAFLETTMLRWAVNMSRRDNGDQSSLLAAIGRNNMFQSCPDTLTDCVLAPATSVAMKVFLADYSKLNNFLDTKATLAALHDSSVRVLHFKGGRKTQMLNMFQALMHKHQAC